MRLIRKYQTPNGRVPFDDWFEALTIREQAIIDRYITRVAVGGASKNIKPIDLGMFEIVIDYGPGFRVYFGRVTESMLLLLGGDKSTQRRDIEQAKEFWRKFREKNHDI